jgi:hypothetical protein
MTPTTIINSNIDIILLDDDPIFRLGLITLLQSSQFSDIEIITQGKLTEALTLLETNQANLLVISLDLATYPEKINRLISISQNINSQYPNLPLLILTPWGSNEIIEKISNVRGCCGRNIEISELIEAIKICARGETYFVKTNSASQSQIVGGWLYRQGQFGLREINKNLAEIEGILAEQLSTSNLIYWSGRKRELKVARWFIKQILPSNPDSFSYNEQNRSSQFQSNYSTFNVNSRDNLIKSQPESSLTLSANELKNSYDLTLAKIQSSVKNCTELTLEIDILKDEKKKELLIIILNEFVDLIQELNYLQLNQEELKNRKDIILKDLWKNSTIKFLSRYSETEINDYSLVDLIVTEAPIIFNENLANIPFIINLLGYEILKKDLIIDNQKYIYNSESAQEIEEILLQNLMINTANIIMQFILNQFYEQPNIKHNLFDLEWKSSRKIAMFRNNLVWKYRKQKYWETPKNIFEDEFLMFKLAYQGIVLCKITHPRNQELNEMKGLPWAVTMLIEFRDSVSRGVKAIGDVIGKTIVYLLTEVIGKGIGLIGKGILQGIGSKIRN